MCCVDVCVSSYLGQALHLTSLITGLNPTATAIPDSASVLAIYIGPVAEQQLHRNCELYILSELGDLAAARIVIADILAGKGG